MPDKHTNPATHRCPACKSLLQDHDIKHEDYLAISLCCDEVAERVFWCETCEEREQHKGCDECIECILDAAVADPRIIVQHTADLQAEIAKGLAERLRPFMRQRQAA